MKILTTIAVFFSILFCNNCSAMGKKPELPELETVPHVDLNRYLGTWHEIASIPQSFQKGCTNTKAEYSLREDGDIRVQNSCDRNNSRSNAEGHAWVVDTQTNAKLKVSFFWPFRGDYWIIDLGENYEYAVVGNPDRDALWVLSRERKMSDAKYAEILSRAQSKGYNLSLIEKAIQD